MYCRIAWYVLSLLSILPNIFKVELSAYACNDDIECRGHSPNSSSVSICCSGFCLLWWNCRGGCISDESCSGDNVCVRNRCQENEIFLQAYCTNNVDCSKGEECESGQCKPAPRPVRKDDSADLHGRFHFNTDVIVIIAGLLGGLIFLAVVSYSSYRFFRWHRRRRYSGGSYSQAPGNIIESYHLCRQHVTCTPRIILPGRTSTPPPEYDSVTLDSNLEVESPYDPDHRISSSTSLDEQV